MTDRLANISYINIYNIIYRIALGICYISVV